MNLDLNFLSLVSYPPKYRRPPEWGNFQNCCWFAEGYLSHVLKQMSYYLEQILKGRNTFFDSPKVDEVWKWLRAVSDKTRRLLRKTITPTGEWLDRRTTEDNVFVFTFYKQWLVAWKEMKTMGIFDERFFGCEWMSETFLSVNGIFGSSSSKQKAET